MAVTFVQAQATSDNASVTVTYSNFAVGAGSDRSLIALVMFEDTNDGWNNTVASVVFNTTESFTYGFHSYTDYGTDDRTGSEVWYLDNPTNTTADVVATMDALVGKLTHLHIIEVTGANNGIGANKAAATGGSAPDSITLNSLNSDSLVVGGFIDRIHTAGPFTATGGTEAIEQLGNSSDTWSGYIAGASGNVTISASATGGGSDWAFAAVEVLAVAVGVTRRIFITHV